MPDLKGVGRTRFAASTKSSRAVFTFSSRRDTPFLKSTTLGRRISTAIGVLLAEIAPIRAHSTTEVKHGEERPG